MKSDWIKSVADHQNVVQDALSVLAHQWDPAVTMLCAALFEGRKVLLCGVGLSAAHASSLASQLVGRFFLDRRVYAALSLSADSAVLTAIGSDYDPAQMFARQVRAQGRTGDVLMALSNTGRHRSVLEAVITAKHLGMGTIGISGYKGMSCDVDIAINSTNAARVQEVSLLIGHLIMEGIEARMPT